MDVEIDVRELVARDLGQPVYRSNRAWKFRCPFHGEQHGAALAVWPDGWHCWGRCDAHGDAIDWLRRYHRLSFADACATLHAQPERREPTKPQLPLPASEPPPADWQQNARRISAATQHLLWTPMGERALAYLKQRGLTEPTIWQAGLGYWPGKPWQWRWLHGALVPCGLVIPWHTDGVTWAIKVRRALGEPKYIAVKGGSTGGLYGADRLTPGCTALLVEGEFDQLTALQEGGDWLVPVTLGAASIRLNSRWQAKLAQCQRVLVTGDNDPAGQQVTADALAKLPNAFPIQYPTGVNDLNALHQCGAGAVQAFLKTYR